MGDRPMSSQKLVLFCDFDGTITEKDNIVDIMRRFAPSGWERTVEDILQQRISIRQGVGDLFARIPSDQRENIIQFVQEHAKIRKGFSEFVQFTRKEGIELLITSGGIDFFLYPMLAPFDLEDKIYCNGSDFTGSTIRITWPHGCEVGCEVDCGMCKTSIIRSYADNDYTKVVIGDSITDLAGAKIADFTIARAFLKEKCIALGLPHQSFENFYDVIEIVQACGSQHKEK
jgi:2-hydroxy-3-keto-5-methylthiopentenyl-1-phosphate phosphatase